MRLLVVVVEELLVRLPVVVVVELLLPLPVVVVVESLLSLPPVVVAVVLWWHVLVHVAILCLSQSLWSVSDYFLTTVTDFQTVLS